MTLAQDIDPAYAAGFAAARAAGVEVIALDCAISPEAVTLRDRVTVR
ncbi:MAG TPA: DNA/RNA nuclease SfsA, partial [Roseovarius nubinhibens]|nr:DNA/RNA nuclease SfsA [Roseovarius nubinhibens]